MFPITNPLHSFFYFFIFSFTDMNVVFHWCIKKDLTPLFTKECDLSSAFCFLSSALKNSASWCCELFVPDETGRKQKADYEDPTLFNVHKKTKKRAKQATYRPKSSPGLYELFKIPTYGLAVQRHVAESSELTAIPSAFLTPTCVHGMHECGQLRKQKRSPVFQSEMCSRRLLSCL